MAPDGHLSVGLAKDAFHVQIQQEHQLRAGPLVVKMKGFRRRRYKCLSEPVGLNSRLQPGPDFIICKNPPLWPLQQTGELEMEPPPLSPLACVP